MDFSNGENNFLYFIFFIFNKIKSIKKYLTNKPEIGLTRVRNEYKKNRKYFSSWMYLDEEMIYSSTTELLDGEEYNQEKRAQRNWQVKLAEKL